MDNIEKATIEAIQDAVTKLQIVFTEKNRVGGSYVTPGNRLMLLSLAIMLDAKDILETGYNTGLTTLVLGLSGANVTGVDNYCEEPGVERVADARLAYLPNVRLVKEDALLFLVKSPSESFDLIFVDDCHWPSYTKHECVEICRLLKPGGCAVFHDTFYAELWEVIQEAFPQSWQRINLPSQQPIEAYSGVETMQGRDLGLGLVRKPWAHSHALRTIDDCMKDEHANDGRQRPSMEVSVQNDEMGDAVIYHGEENNVLVEMYTHILRAKVPSMNLSPKMEEHMLSMLRAWGAYCSNCASFVGQQRYVHNKPSDKDTHTH